MKEYLYINSRDELYKIDIAKIVYFEAEGNYTNFVLSNKLKGAVCMNLAQMQKLINDTCTKRVPCLHASASDTSSTSTLYTTSTC